MTHLKELAFIHVTQDAADSWYGLAAAIGHQIEKFKIIEMTIDADEQINAISQMKNAKVMLKQNASFKFLNLKELNVNPGEETAEFIQ